MFRLMALATMAMILTACGSNPAPTEADGQVIKLDEKTSGLAVQLGGGSVGQTKPGPAADISSLLVTVDHIEVVLKNSSRTGRLEIASGLGSVNLMSGQGLPLPLAQVQIPSDLTVGQIRLLLGVSGHQVVMNDGTTCELKTPSAQQSGLKIVIPGGLKLNGATNYTLALNVDPSTQVVWQGNGRCLLKPVIRLDCGQKRGEDRSQMCVFGETDNGSTNDDGTSDNSTGDSGSNNDGSTDGDNASDDGSSGWTDPNDLPSIDDPWLYF